ncbi:hypothetical protein ACFRQM_03565 [Streptomyces sp. NPDC056831]|uniref:hypothetical protein n=1 Tax=Streptomyces sp. NPDC056831 TaxID=3345954 RepID=UPI00367439E3
MNGRTVRRTCGRARPHGCCRGRALPYARQSRTTTYGGEHYANGWSDPARFTVDTAWKPTAAENTLGAGR